VNGRPRLTSGARGQCLGVGDRLCRGHQASPPRGLEIRCRAAGLVLVALSASLLGVVSSSTSPASPVSLPTSTVGSQLSWFLGTTARLPLSATEIAAHFDTQFLAQVSSTELNSILEETPGSMQLVSVAMVGTSALTARVSVSGIGLKVDMSVDTSGLIDGLRLTPIISAPFHRWASIDHELTSVAPGVGFLAARVGVSGTCVARHALASSMPRPTGSMFKLFVLGALANAVHDHRVRWGQKLSITAASKVGGSGTLVNVPNGTQLSVQQVADLMVSESDNTAADLLIDLVGRAAVEDQVRRWSSHASLDIPFLTVSEFFALKYGDFPALADHYLSLDPAQRAAYLTSTVDAVTPSQEVGTTQPRDINSIEWFASPADLCRAFSGLAALDRTAGLSPVGGALSLNNGGIDLPSALWPSVWFKGGSESGVLTLGYRARDRNGQTFTVVVMIENPQSPFAEEVVTTKLLDVVSSAFALLQRGR
jgi:hypothetical protein